jgi:hypothetical protein
MQVRVQGHDRAVADFQPAAAGIDRAAPQPQDEIREYIDCRCSVVISCSMQIAAAISGYIHVAGKLLCDIQTSEA